ncbi:hypothetical protein VNO77_22889 [Canavalia gladiata]|uniref:Uncharacterized protein n=1 Tax=Canavalia gladiata TaxID=3824 RepID=A0AAN9L3Y3_CANGL
MRITPLRIRDVYHLLHREGNSMGFWNDWIDKDVLTLFAPPQYILVQGPRPIGIYAQDPGSQYPRFIWFVRWSKFVKAMYDKLWRWRRKWLIIYASGVHRPHVVDSY